MNIRASRKIRRKVAEANVNELPPDPEDFGVGAAMSNRTNDVPTCWAGITRRWHRFAADGTQRRGRRECGVFGISPELLLLQLQRQQ